MNSISLPAVEDETVEDEAVDNKAVHGEATVCEEYDDVDKL